MKFDPKPSSCFLPKTKKHTHENDKMIRERRERERERVRERVRE